ncbi:MAG TPA: thioredoxin domain-containing protein [Puia sp.]|nr:thioredoxin domain-containing protein [Puia sp.]
MNKQITKKQLMIEVRNNLTLSLVQFKTEWSGASQIISPVYEELAHSYKGAVNFFSIDIDEETAAAEEFGVTEIPTILFFKNGKVVDHVIGLTPKNVLIMKIENALTQNN